MLGVRVDVWLGVGVTDWLWDGEPEPELLGVSVDV